MKQFRYSFIPNTAAYKYLGTADGSSNTDDLDNIYGVGSTGFYFVEKNVANCPIEWAGLIVTESGPSSFQLLYNDEYMYFRGRVGNPQAWGLWHMVYGPTAFVRGVDQNNQTTMINGFSKNSKISNVERLNITRKSYIVIVDLIFTVGTAITDNIEILFSGLPIPTSGGIRFRCPSGTNSSNTLVLSITSNGEIMNQWSPGGIATGQYQCSFMYISESNYHL